MLSTLAQNTIDLGSILALGTVFHIFITTPTTLVSVTSILYKLHTVLNLLCICLYKCLVIVSIWNTYNSRGTSLVVCTNPLRQGAIQIGACRYGCDFREHSTLIGDWSGLLRIRRT